MFLVDLSNGNQQGGNSDWRIGFVISRPGFDSLVKSYQKTLKNGIHCFPTQRLP